MEERLRQFKGLVEAGSFTGAARTLHISQPALSASVAKLERELNVRLLNRRLKPLTLTPAGQVAYLHALEHELHLRRLKRELATHSTRKPQLSIGMIDSLAALFCADSAPLDELESHYELSLIIDSSSRLLEQVRTHKLDYAFVASYEVSGANIRIIGYEPLLHVAAPNRNPERLICYNRGSTTFRIIEQHFLDQGLQFAPAFYSTSPEVMCQLVLQGRGSAVLPLLTVRPYLKSGVLTVTPATRLPVIKRPIATVAASPADDFKTISATLGRRLVQLQKEADRLIAPTKLPSAGQNGV